MDLNAFLNEVGEPSPQDGSYVNRRRSMTNDQMAQWLCLWCKAHDVTKQSLELQIWWRDHQAADAKREAAEREAQRLRGLRRQAAAKLTPEELTALGLEGHND